MSNRSFTNEVSIRVPVDAVSAAIYDAMDFIRLNPGVVAAKQDPLHSDQYRVVSRQHLFGIPFKVRARLRIQRLDDGLATESWSPFGVHLRSVWRLLPAAEQTRVLESTEIEAPRLLIEHASAISRRSHGDMLFNLKQRLERLGR